jgi:aspartyl-tRNA(Asn)/glutamyl-tRNA(Gln) amidotransferase subunit B
MRSKEEAHDYRYFPEPDLVPVVVGDRWVEEIRSSLPELPDAKRKRFIVDHGLSEQDAEMLTSERAVADWFEAAAGAGGQAKAISNWMMGDLMRYLNEEGRSISECPLKPSQLAVMLRLIEDGTISGKLAKTVFDEMCRTGKDADVIVREQGLVQISDKDAIESVVDETLARNPKEVARYRAGEEKLLGFFVGQVMKQTKGKANPQILNDLLKRKLSG